MCKPCRNAAFSPKKANYDRIGSVFARYGAFPRQTPTKCRKIGHRKFKFEFVNNILICSFPESHAAPPARAGASCGRSGRPQPGGAQSGLFLPAGTRAGPVPFRSAGAPPATVLYLRFLCVKKPPRPFGHGGRHAYRF